MGAIEIKNLTYIEAKIDISKLTDDKEFTVTLTKPAGVRYMTETSTTVDVKLDTETSKEFSGIVVEHINKAVGYTPLAVTTEDQSITVIAKGVSSVLENVDASKIKAYIDLSGYTEGTYDIPVNVTIDDVRVTLVAKKTTVKIKITN